jgi:hypothetical protein
MADRSEFRSQIVIDFIAPNATTPPCIEQGAATQSLSALLPLLEVRKKNEVPFLVVQRTIPSSAA